METHLRIRIAALAVKDNRNGTFTITLPGNELSPEASAMLAELFPHCADEVQQLLGKEALIQAMQFLPPETVERDTAKKMNSNVQPY